MTTIQIQKYPKLTHDEKRSTKLTLKEIAEIRSLFAIGYTYKKLSEMYHVSNNTIRYWCDENHRKEHLRKGTKRTREKLKDPKTKAHWRALIRNSARQRRNDFPRIAKYLDTTNSISKRIRREKNNYADEIRYNRKSNLNGFRMFWNRIEGVSPFNITIDARILSKQLCTRISRNYNLNGFRLFWNRIEGVSPFQKCSMSDCKRDARARGFCRVHYYHCYTTLQKDLIFFKQFWDTIEDVEKCSVIDCKKHGHLTRGFCSHHYYHCYIKVIKSGGLSNG